MTALFVGGYTEASTITVTNTSVTDNRAIAVAGVSTNAPIGGGLVLWFNPSFGLADCHTIVADVVIIGNIQKATGILDACTSSDMSSVSSSPH